MLLKGKICVITGAGSARCLGRATARLISTHGARVVVLDIDLATARDTVAALKGRGHMALRCDVNRRGRRQESHSIDDMFERLLFTNLSPRRSHAETCTSIFFGDF